MHGKENHDTITTMEKIKIAAIVGSLRQESLNKQLAINASSVLNELSKELQEEIEFEILDYTDVPVFNQDMEYPAPPSVKRVRDIIKSANGVWFFSPEYNHFFSGALKNLIDWLSRPINESEPQVLGGKAAAVSGISPGVSGTLIAQDHLITLLSFLNMKIMNYPRLFIPNGLQQVDDGGKLKLTTSAPFLKKQAEAFIQFLKNS